MAIADDFSVAVNGDVRYTGSGTNYAVIAFHRYLQDKADDASAANDDLLQITDDTPSDRSTDNIITLINDYNIDDTAAEHLYDGSVTQDSGDTVYAGLVIVGAVEAGTELQILQNGQLLRNYWGTGINADAAANILMRLMVKVRVDGVDIDSKRLRVQARELGDKYGEFSLTAGLGNNTAAVFTSGDLNNTTVEATIDGWDTITNTEGLRKIDVDDDSVDEDYYSEWNRDSYTINQLYERTKWIQKRPSSADSATETGTDYVVDDGTISGQGQEFTARNQAEKLVSCTFSLKIGLGTPIGTLIAELYDSDSASPAAPTGAVLATSVPVLVNVVGASYADVEFVFHDNVTLTASQEYFIALRNADATASHYISAQGAAAGSHAGNLATDTAGWAGVAAADLAFSVEASPMIHALPGALFRGITHSFGWDTEAGTPTMAANEDWAWGTLVQVSGVGGTFVEGEAIHEDTATPVWVGRVIAYDLADTSLLIVHESGTITGTDTFTGQTSGATATADSSVAPQTANSGGRMRLLAFEDDGVDGEAYVQLLYGAAPVDEEILYCVLDTADSLPAHDQSVTVESTKLAITSRTISPEFLGASTGSAIIGAYGIGVEFADLADTDQLFDLTNTQRVPPTQSTFTVSGMTGTGGRLLVAPRSGSAINTTQMTLNTTLNGAGVTNIDVGAGNIPADTPDTGILRIVLDDGRHYRIAYTAHDGDDGFTVASTDFSDPDDATAGNGVYIAYLDGDYATDSANFILVFDSTRDLFVRFRDGRPGSAIKTFENVTAQLLSTGGSAAVIRTPDV